MKSMAKNLMMFSAATLFLSFFISCQNDADINTPDGYVEILDVSSDGTSPIVESKLKETMVFTSEPATEEQTILLNMLDEEKLARDVYLTLNDIWKSMVFEKIAGAEQKHLNAVVYLINTCTNMEVTEGNPGEYSNETFNALYEQLVTEGSESLENAYAVGALIEELDIYDLDNYLLEITNENIIIAFENLLRGSKNHLRAFTINLELLGASYTPQYISQEYYDEIVNSPMEQGKRYRKQNGNGNGNSNGGGNGNGTGGNNN